MVKIKGLSLREPRRRLRLLQCWITGGSGENSPPFRDCPRRSAPRNDTSRPVLTVHQHPPAVEYSRTGAQYPQRARRIHKAAEQLINTAARALPQAAIALPPFSIPVQSCQYCFREGPPATIAGAVLHLRRTIKRPGIPRPLRLPLSSPPNRCTRIVRNPCNQKSRIQEHGETSRN